MLPCSSSPWATGVQFRYARRYSDPGQSVTDLDLQETPRRGHQKIGRLFKCRLEWALPFEDLSARRCLLIPEASADPRKEISRRFYRGLPQGKEKLCKSSHRPVSRNPKDTLQIKKASRLKPERYSRFYRGIGRPKERNFAKILPWHAPSQGETLIVPL